MVHGMDNLAPITRCLALINYHWRYFLRHSASLTPLGVVRLGDNTIIILRQNLHSSTGKQAYQEQREIIIIIINSRRVSI